MSLFLSLIHYLLRSHLSLLHVLLSVSFLYVFFFHFSLFLYLVSPFLCVCLSHPSYSFFGPFLIFIFFTLPFFLFPLIYSFLSYLPLSLPPSFVSHLFSSFYYFSYLSLSFFLPQHFFLPSHLFFLPSFPLPSSIHKLIVLNYIPSTLLYR